MCYNYHMFKQKPFPFSFIILAILIVVHLFASYYSLYWRWPYFDILVHLISGLWIALVFLWLASVFEQVNSLKEYKIKTFLIAFVSAVLFGVIWELLENFYQITYTNMSSYGLDTALDILGDALGGILAFLYFVKRKRCTGDTCEILHPFYNQTGLIKN